MKVLFRVVTQEVDKFRLEVEMGIGYQSVSATKDIHPDMGFLLADGVQEKRQDDYGRKHYVNPQIVIVECENSRLSTLIRGTPSVRLYGYLLLKERNRRLNPKRRPIFVLVTWEGNRDAYKDVGLWDHVWFVPGEGADEPVAEDLPIDRDGENGNGDESSPPILTGSDLTGGTP